MRLLLHLHLELKPPHGSILPLVSSIVITIRLWVMRLGRIPSLLRSRLSRPLFPRLFELCFLVWSRSIFGASFWSTRRLPSCIQSDSTWPQDHQRGQERADPFQVLSSWDLLCRADMFFWWQPISGYKYSRKYGYIDEELPTHNSNRIIKDILTDGAM